MHRLRPHLTYANVMVTLLAFGALTGGVAYAANTIGSSDIIDESIQSVDLKNGQVKSSDIGNNQVQSVDVKELSQFSEAAGAANGCTADDHTLNACVTANITLERAGRLLLDASGEWTTFHLDDINGPGSDTDDPKLVTGACQLFVDGTAVGDQQRVGERSAAGNASHPFDAPGTLALSGLSASLAAGPHVATVGCTEVDGDLDWTVINLTAGLVAD